MKNNNKIETINTGGGCMVDFYYDPNEKIAVLINEEICNIIEVDYENLEYEVYNESFGKITEVWGCEPNLKDKEDMAYLILDGISECMTLDALKLISFINLTDEEIEYDCGDMDEKTKLEIIGNLIKINKK